MSQLHKLTQRDIDSAKPYLKPYTLPDGGGLVLKIMPNNSRRWRFRYRFHGVEKMMSLGTYPAVSLTLARKLHKEARTLLEQGIDPSADKKAKKASHALSFKAVAEEWMTEEYAPSVTEQTLRETRSRYERYVFPLLGNKPINEISVPDVRTVLDKIHARGAAETVKKTRQGMSQVFRHAMLDGRASSDPAAVLSGVKKYSPAKQRKHRPSIVDREDGTTVVDLKKIGSLLRSVESYDGHLFTKLGLKLLALTAVRPGEVRKARWEDVDLEKEVWLVPGYRKKERVRDLVVPLASQSVEILSHLRSATGDGEYVFGSIKGGWSTETISENTLARALWSLGFKGMHSPHGYRALFRTVLTENLGFDRDMVRIQLAHKTRDPMGGAYDRTTWITDRTIMMKVWADFLDLVRTEQNVDPMTVKKLRSNYSDVQRELVPISIAANH